MTPNLSTGLGIELAWAREAGIQVIFTSQKEAAITTAPKYVWAKDKRQFIHIEYNDGRDLIEKLSNILCENKVTF